MSDIVLTTVRQTIADGYMLRLAYAAADSPSRDIISLHIDGTVDFDWEGVESVAKLRLSQDTLCLLFPLARLALVARATGAAGDDGIVHMAGAPMDDEPPEQMATWLTVVGRAPEAGIVQADGSIAIRAAGSVIAQLSALNVGTIDLDAARQEAARPLVSGVADMPAFVARILLAAHAAGREAVAK